MITTLQIATLDWEKMHNLVPAIIQDAQTLQVLMLGYMDKAALAQTCATHTVTFYSRSKQRLWTKGETSGHYLSVVDITPDCDQDTLLVRVKSSGPCCHLGNTSCFLTPPTVTVDLSILSKLLNLITERYQTRPPESYTTQLFDQGTPRIAQKVGEEGVEVALAAVIGDKTELVNEASDLIFHLFVLLRQANVEFTAVLNEIAERMVRFK